MFQQHNYVKQITKMRFFTFTFLSFLCRLRFRFPASQSQDFGFDIINSRSSRSTICKWRSLFQRFSFSISAVGKQICDLRFILLSKELLDSTQMKGLILSLFLSLFANFSSTPPTIYSIYFFFFFFLSSGLYEWIRSHIRKREQGSSFVVRGNFFKFNERLCF